MQHQAQINAEFKSMTMTLLLKWAFTIDDNKDDIASEVDLHYYLF